MGTNTTVVSDDGRHVAFSSNSSNLVSGAGGLFAVFVRDTTANTTVLASVSSAGVIADGQSYDIAISGDGRYVAFQSFASNLVAGNTHNQADGDVYVHDLITGITTRVSVDSAGNQSNGNSDDPSLSTDGRFVAFHSDASNLVASDTNGHTDVFVHDMLTGVTTLVSVDANGGQGNDDSEAGKLSGDGKFVSFCSLATNLVLSPTAPSGIQQVYRTSRIPQQGVLARASGNQTSEAGGTVDLAFTLGTQPSHDVTVALSVSDATEGELSTASRGSDLQRLCDAIDRAGKSRRRLTYRTALGRVEHQHVDRRRMHARWLAHSARQPGQWCVGSRHIARGIALQFVDAVVDQHAQLATPRAGLLVLARRIGDQRAPAHELTATIRLGFHGEPGVGMLQRRGRRGDIVTAKLRPHRERAQ